MRKTVLLLALFGIMLAAASQTSSRNDELKLDADYYLILKEYDKALDLYLKINKTESENADVKHRIGICYLNSEDQKAKAIPYLEEAVKKVSAKYNANSLKEDNTSFEAYFTLGSAYRVNNDLDKAIEAYTRFKEYLDPDDKYNIDVADQYIRSCNLARDMIQHPVEMTVVNVGKAINNDKPNFNAVVSGDGKTMAYTTPGRQGYDIFTTTLSDTGWTTPKNITSVLATGKYMKTCDISYDGLSMLLSLDDPENADIFISHFAKGRWSKVEPLGKNINSKSNETHASISADNKKLYFTSDRKGGLGDLDIYSSELNSKGDWEKPVNLGSAVNTKFNEETPFVTEDGTELFFSSEGHDGIGGYDIYRFNLEKPGATAVNLGYPLNTTDNNLFYYPATAGTTAYYAMTGQDSYGARDIYLVSVPEPVPEALPAMAEIQPVIIPEEVLPALPEIAPETVAVIEPEPMVEPAPIVEPEPEPSVEPEVIPEVEKEVFATESAAINEQLDVVSVTEPGIVKSYTVQFMALRKPVDIQYFSSLKEIVLTYANDKWYRYTYGITEVEADAEKIRNSLVEKGFQDAFVLKKTVIPAYTIQLMAVPGPVVDLTGFKGIACISVYRGADNFCRYTTGEFESKQEALAALEKIRQSGYNTAFVRKLGN
jgi:tetratricopeptide (TPR) repeat protein